MNQTHTDIFSDHNETNYTYYDEYLWNINESPLDQESTAMKVTSLILFCLTFLLGVPGNVFVVYIAGMKMKRTINTIWFLNLAIADLLCCLFIPFNVAAILLDHHWPYGSVMCKILPTFIVVNMFASVFTLNVISLDRFTQVITPVWSQNHRNLMLARVSCVVAWVLSLLLSMPFMILRETYDHLNVTICSLHGYEEGETNTSGKLTVIRFVFGFLIPLICIVTCYGFIARKLGRSNFHSGRAFRIMSSVIVAFFLCWLPYHIMDLIRIYGGETSSSVALAVDPLVVSLAYFNSCLNPVLYVFMGQDFKEKVKLSLRHVFQRAFSEEGTQISRSTQSQQMHSM